MNASQIISEDMTLEEKLKAIDEAIAAAQNKAKIDANKNNTAFFQSIHQILLCARVASN